MTEFWKNRDLNDITYQLNGELAIEIWKDVVGYEGHYMVSDLGRVKSLKRKVPHSFSGHITMPNRILSQKRRERGDLEVNLAKEGIHISSAVHRLVAIAFISNPEKLPEVNHKWGKVMDNRVTELEWISSSDNKIHSYQILNRRKPNTKGEKNPRFAYFLNIQTGIFYTYSEIANHLNVTVNRARQIIFYKDERVKNFIKT